MIRRSKMMDKGMVLRTSTLPSMAMGRSLTGPYVNTSNYCRLLDSYLFYLYLIGNGCRYVLVLGNGRYL